MSFLSAIFHRGRLIPILTWTAFVGSFICVANAALRGEADSPVLLVGALTLMAIGGFLLGRICGAPVAPEATEIMHYAKTLRLAPAGRRVRERAAGPWSEVVVAFNTLITARQDAEDRLQKAQASLEAKVSARTAEIWRANLALKAQTEQRARAEHELYQAQKMDALGKLSGSIAHDFNNLLGVIIGGVEGAQNQLPKNHATQHLLRMVQKAGERAADLTRPLLTFSRNQVLPVDTREVNTAADETAMMLQRLLGANVDLRLELTPDLPHIRANGSQLAQVIMNLGINARDAMEGMGILTISTAHADVSREQAAEKGVPECENWVQIAVRDTGCGMDEATKARIFEPFFTTKPVGKGTGLGLSTVFGIVKQLHGFVEVDSQLGIGTTFRVMLPTISAAEAKAAADSLLPKTPSEPAVQGNETILLVDDEEDLLELATLTLEMRGYRVLAAPSATEAILLVEQHRHEIRALVTDVMMPEMNGVQLAEVLTKINPALRVLFVSGHSNEIISPAGLSAAKAEYLQKPYRGDALAQKVHDLLQARVGDAGEIDWAPFCLN